MEKRYLNDTGLVHLWSKVKFHVKDSSDALQSQIDDKQKQITANDGDISVLQDRSTQMEESIKSIAATGGASTADAVTYNNTDSDIVAVTAQGAIDELNLKKLKKSQYAQSIEPSGNGYYNTISVNIKNNSITISSKGFSVFFVNRTFVSPNKDITLTASSDVTRTSVYINENVINNSNALSTDDIFIIKQDTEYDGVLFAEWYNGVLQPCGLVADLVPKEYQRLKYLKETIQFYSTEVGNYCEKGSSSIFLNLRNWHIRSTVKNKEYVDTKTIADEAGVSLVTSSKGKANCLELSSANCLVLDLYDFTFSIVDRYEIQPYHLCVLSQINGKIIYMVPSLSAYFDEENKYLADNFGSESSQYVSTKSFTDKTGQSFTISCFIKQGRLFKVKATCTNNISSGLTDVYAYNVAGTSDKLIQQLSIGKVYFIRTPFDIYTLTAYQQGSKLTGESGDVTLEISMSNSADVIERNGIVISDDIEIGSANQEFTGKETTGKKLSISAFIPKGTKVYCKFTQSVDVITNTKDFALNYTDGTSIKYNNDLYVNEEYSLVAEKDVSSISVYTQAKFLTGKPGTITLSAYTKRVDNYNILEKKDFILTPAYKDYADKILAEKGDKFLLCVQTDTHVDYMGVKDEPKYHTIETCNNLRLISAYCGADCMANLGDLVEGYQYDCQNFMRRTMSEAAMRYCYPFACPSFLVVGNHDDGYLYWYQHQDEVGSDKLTKSEVYARMIKPSLNTLKNVGAESGKLYYYSDFDNIRVIVLNSQDGGDSLWDFGFSEEQISWFKTKALNTDKQVLIMCHCPLLSTLSSDCPSSASSILSALAEFKNKGGVIIGCLAGHTHKQQMEVDDNGITHVVFISYGLSIESLLIDITNKNVQTKCYGTFNSMEDREWNYI